MQSSSLVILSTLLILAIMAGTFLFFYLGSLVHEIQREWQGLIQLLHHRLDKIPNMIETVKTSVEGQENLIQEIIHLRAQSRQLDLGNAKKVHYELLISQKLGELLQYANAAKKIQYDTNFLALKIEFKKLDEEIEKLLENYNHKIRSYNKWLKFIILKPFTLLFRYHKLSIFEFEGVENALQDA